MKHIINLFCIPLLMVVCCTACAPQKSESDKKMEEALPKIDELAGNFDPSIEVKPESSHRAITVKVNPDGTLMLDSATMNSPLRKGRLPYTIEKEQKRDMPFVVSWYDANNRRLGGYSVESPMVARTCEDGNPAIRTAGIESFEVLLPSDQNISSFQLTANGKVMGTFSMRGRQ